MLESPRRAAGNFGRGVLMGGADVVPGVSGGTVALIVGIYARLVSSIRAVVGVPLGLLRRDRESARAQARETEWSLLIPLAAGILVALGVGTMVLPGLLEAYPVGTNAVFFGLVAASLAVPWRRISRIGSRAVTAAAIAALVAFVLVGLPPAGVASPSLGQVFLSAAVAICAMILPGVSGAFLLKALGVYEATLEAAGALDVVYVAVFGAGAIVGLGAFAKLLDWLLSRRYDLTMASLVGLMAGSLRALWPWQSEGRDLLAPPAEPSVIGTVALVLAGFAAVMLLIRVAGSDEPASESGERAAPKPEHAPAAEAGPEVEPDSPEPSGGEQSRRAQRR
jgi:putative membrane protein